MGLTILRQIAPRHAQNQHFRRGDVAGKGDVVFIALLGNIDDFRIGLFFVGIVKAKHQIDFVIGDAGGDLLSAAVVE